MANSKRYLLISPAFPPPFVGGSKVWTYNMVENSPEAFDILTSALKPGYQEVCKRKHRVFRSRFIWDSNTGDPSLFDLTLSYSYIIAWLVWRLFTVRYQAVVAGAFVFGNGLIFLVCRLLRIPCIGLGNAEEFTLVLYGKGWKDKIKRPWLMHTHRLATGFIVVCHFCKDILVGIGVKPERIDVVPSSINPQKLLPPLAGRVSGYQVLSVGRLVERKGFHHLIEAIALLRNELPDIKVVIVGNGPFKPVLQHRIAELGLHHHVEIRDSVEDEELSSLYRESDLFVLAHMMLENGDTEGCPTVFSEASGCGLPVIGGTGGGADTVIVHGETGYIVNSRNIAELAERIKTVLTQPRLAAAMGLAGMEKVRREHTPEVTGRAFFASVRKFSTGSSTPTGLCGSEYRQS